MSGRTGSLTKTTWTDQRLEKAQEALYKIKSLILEAENVKLWSTDLLTPEGNYTNPVMAAFQVLDKAVYAAYARDREAEAAICEAEAAICEDPDCTNEDHYTEDCEDSGCTRRHLTLGGFC